MKLAAAGHATALLTLTRGDKGRWFGKELGSWSPQDLAAERTREWQAATGVIGFTHARLLEWPDGGLAASPVDRVTADVVEFIRERVLKPVPPVNARPFDAALKTLAGRLKPELLVNARPF